MSVTQPKKRADRTIYQPFFLISAASIGWVAGAILIERHSGAASNQWNSGLTAQISSAYSRMVRSEENAPIPATFMMAWRVHSVGVR